MLSLMYIYLSIKIGALAAITDATDGNVTVTKDKRQVQHVHDPAQNFVPSSHPLGGQHNYDASSEQITAVSCIL